MRKNVYIVILAFMLCATMMSIGAIEKVSADGEGSLIYINHNDNFTLYADSGSGVAGDPYLITGDVLTSTGDGSVYIQNTNAYAIITDCVMNGAGYYGIYLRNVDNLNITNCDIYDKSAALLIDDCNRIFVSGTNITNRAENDYGIRIDASTNISIRDCNIFAAEEGLQLWNSFRVEIIDNAFTGTGITFYGTCQVSTGIKIQSNTVNGKPLGYLYNAHDRIINIVDYGQVILVSSVNVSLHHGNISDTNSGVEFIFCQNSNLAFSNVTGCKRGVLLYESAYSRLYQNNLTGNTHGIMGYFATGSIIHENNLLNNEGYGIWMWYGCSSSVVYLNNFIDNQLGNARDDGGIEDSNLIWLGARFRNSVSRYPLPNTSITIERGGRSYTGYTNEKGLFKVPLPELGAYNFTVERFRYQTKYFINHVIDQYGIHLYGVEMDKADLGAGTGYVLARFMDGANPVVGVSVKVYSVLDGAYYFHSEYTSAVSPAGWVNITGLYFDDYIFVITHPDYEQNIIQQVIISNGYVGTYNNIQLTAYPTDAFVYGNVTDEITGVPLENANVTIYNEIREAVTVFTDSTGLYNITNIPLGVYYIEISLTDYNMVYDEFSIDVAGSQAFNPFDFGMVPDDYIPDEPEQASTNSWDNTVKGNYWDDFNGSVYEILGINEGDPIDEYPLSEMVEIHSESEPEPKPEMWSDSLEIYESETPDGRINVNSLCTVRWKVRWAGNGTELRNGLTMMIRVNGSGVDELLLAEYIDEWWTVSYNHTEPALLEFSVYSVVSYGMTEFVQLVENVEVIWDRVIIIVVTTNTNITTTTTTTTITTGTIEPTPDIEIVQDMAMIVVGIIGVIVIAAVVVVVIKKE